MVQVVPGGCHRVAGTFHHVVARYFLPLPDDRLAERVIRCVIGLALCGLGISMFFAADLGVAPWDVLHVGIANVTGLPVGLVLEIVSLLVLLIWLPLKERWGLGTLMNALEIGLVVLAVVDQLPRTDALVGRVAYMLGGLVVMGAGTGVYINAGLGSGPRDGLMLACARRGISVRRGRTAIELLVLVVGLTLGGPIGIGTAVFAFGIGPMVHFFMPRTRLPNDSLVLVAVR